MNRKETIISRILLALTGAMALAAAIYIAGESHEPELEWPGKLRGVLEINCMADTSSSLIVGYNYYLLERYAREHEQKIEIILADRNLSYIDSLKSGAVDIVVFPYGNEVNTDSLVVSAPIDSSSVWLLHNDKNSVMWYVNNWIDQWHHSEEYQEVRDSYLKRFSIFKAGSKDRLSPYDEIIKASADSIGFDWRPLAAIIYKESRFHIEAKSSRGARGLLQMMPHTANNYGAEDPLNPEVNIRAGASLLGSLIKRFSTVAKDEEETIRFALAAYNAGVGRIDDCINYARYKEVDTGTWDSIVQVIPEMSADGIMDSGVVKVGPFKGIETISYVETVLGIYDRICLICKER